MCDAINYLTTSHTFQIYGVCEDCRKGDPQVEDGRRKTPAVRTA